MQPRTDLIHWNAETDEPFIALPSFPESHLTPWRHTDAGDAMKLFNDPTVGKYAFRRPYPYLTEHLNFIWDLLMPCSKTTIDNTLRPILTSPRGPKRPLPPPGNQVPFFPIIVVRHVPSGRLIGEAQIFQPTDPGADQDIAFGGKLPQTIPPEKQTWEIGYNLLPEWRGKGLGGELLSLMVESWVSWVGIGTLMASIQTENPASGGLVKSRGFSRSKTFMQTWPEDKGGGEREVTHWVLKVSDYVPRLPPSSKDSSLYPPV